MGLDTVELIMSVEDAFNITIEDQEAERLQTLGQIYALVRAKTAGRAGARCLTAHAFRRLRAAIAGHVTVIPRIAPATPLADAFPVDRRRALWPSVSADLLRDGLRLPPLSHSPRDASAGCAATFFGAVATGLGSGVVTATPAVGVIAFLVALPVIAVAAHFFRPAPTDVPNCATVGDLARRVMWLNADILFRETRTLRERETWDAVRGLVADAAGVPPDSLTPETNILKLF
jgi:hypothetical protein